jgi:hypothetical protein
VPRLERVATAFRGLKSIKMHENKNIHSNLIIFYKFE